MIPKDFLERIRSTENSDIMNKLTFEKAEQTYFCLNYVIKTLESMGHQLHCLEMYAFLRFFVKEILNAPSQAQTLVECKYSRYLNSIGLVNEGNQLYQGLTFNKFFPSEAEERDLIARVQASVVETKNKKSEGTMLEEDKLEEDKQKKRQLIVKEIQIHNLWIELSQELITFGQISKAKQLLNHAFEHAKILNDIDNLSLIELSKAKISFLEGRYVESLEACMRGFSYPKELS
mmetsp:Transcript_29561/g.26980  ORF Transcript_29561/g.26980 Transcript_29561/m.26980 type:complete len:233 (+) Transcript_29561:613-1311(+)